MNHIMIDLETLSTAPTAAIVSIGAVKMDLEKFELGETFYAVIDIEKDYGLTMDTATIKWWMTKSEEARAVFNASSGDLKDVLSNFLTYAGVGSALWGNGATFDNVILRNAYKAVGLTYPTSYRNDLCFRTMRRMLEGDARGKQDGVQHNALDDAIWQAQTLLNILKEQKAMRELYERTGI